MAFDAIRRWSIGIGRGAALVLLLFIFLGPVAQAAQVDLESAYFRDGLATALIILRNDDEPHGYATVDVECEFDTSGGSVGTSTAEINDLRYRQHTAVRLSTPVNGDRFDRASCRVTDAKIK